MPPAGTKDDKHAGAKNKGFFSGWGSSHKKSQEAPPKKAPDTHVVPAAHRRQRSDDPRPFASPASVDASGIGAPPSPSAKQSTGSGDSRAAGGLPGGPSQAAHSLPFPSVRNGPTPVVVSDVYSRWGRWSTLYRTLTCPPPSRTGQPIGLLELDIFEGFGLPASDMGISSDPYLVATLTG
jgi:hypothetical protein